MAEGTAEPGHDDMATTAGKRPVSPWPKVVLVLGVILIIAATTVAAVAFWPRDSPQPVSVPSPEPTLSTPSPTVAVSPATAPDLSPEAPIGSDYEQFGAECGGHLTAPWPGACAEENGGE